MTRHSLVSTNLSSLFILTAILCLVPLQAAAFQLSPSTISEPEGTVIDLEVTISPSDWQMPDSYWVTQCANFGNTPDADWIALTKFEFVDGTAEFGNGPNEGDLHFRLGNTPQDDRATWFQCETGSMPPDTLRYWTTFDIVLNNDELQEPDEFATLHLLNVPIGGSPSIADSIDITILGNESGPYSDWSVTVTGVMPTTLYTTDEISITAVGERFTNPDYIYQGGYDVSFLVSTNPTIEPTDMLLARRSFDDFIFAFRETFVGTLGVTPGTYWVGACSTIADDNPENDCSAGVEVTVLTEDTYPDLAVIYLDTSPATITSGEDLDILTDIRNVGNAASASSPAYVYLSLDDLVSENDIEIANATVDALEPGQTWRGQGQVPVNVPAGDYYVILCVDPVPDEMELLNNCGAGPRLTVLPGDGCSGQPLSCDSLASGTLDSEDCTDGPRGANRYAEYFTFDGELGDRLFLGAEYDSSLDGYLLLQGPNERIVAQNDNYTSTANSRIEYELKQNGQYKVWVTSFGQAQMGGFDVTLNCDSPPGADLTVDAPSVSDGSLVPGQKMRLESRLRNIGTAQADSTRLRYLLSSNSTIDLTDTELGSDGAGGLAAGSSRAAGRDLVAPSTPGIYYVGVCADVIPDEASTSNNCSAGTQIFVESPPSCTRRALACGQFLSGMLDTGDCTGSPRGSGFFGEVLEVDASAGRTLVFEADWGSDLDGYLLVRDPSGAVVAQNDDGLAESDGAGPGSLIQFRTSQGGIHELWVTSADRDDMGSFGVELICGASSSPDLAASQVSIDLESVNTGEAIGISGTVFNQGNVPSGDSVVNVMLSSNEVITRFDPVVGSVSISSLNGGASIPVQSMVSAPETPGNYWLGLCVEPVEGETLTTNNCSLAGESGTLSAIESGGDRAKPQNDDSDSGTLLVVSSGNSCGSASMSCGGSVGGTLGTADCDTGPRGAGYVSDPITFNGVSGDIVSISAGWSEVDGYLYLEDPLGNIVAENDDTDGTGGSRLEIKLERSGTYTVWPTAFGQDGSGGYQVNLECNNPQAPDLEVDKPQLSATTLRAGQSINIRTQARNKGGFTAGQSGLEFILAANPELGDGDRILRSSDVPALAGGSSSTESADVAIQAPPGTYYIGTCVNLDTRETDTDNNCKVSDPITVEATPDPIEINSGLNDAWYNPATSGQGFFINIFPDNSQVFLSWFTFDTTRPASDVSFQLGDPGHRWLTAQGSYDLGVAELNVFLTQGGVFDAGQPAATTNPTPYGTMKLSFSDCNNGLIEYNLPAINDSGSIAITRVSSENVAACQEELGGLSAATAARNGAAGGIEADASGSRIEAGDDNPNSFNYNPSLNDAWFNPATNGQGFFFNIFPDSNFVFLSWFTYDVTRPANGTPANLGEPGHRWLTAQGPFNGDTAEMKIYNTSGGIFNQGSLPPENTVEVGTMTASFQNCNAGVISYTLDSVNRQNDIPIQRTAPDTIPACEADSSGSGAGAGAGTGDAEGSTTAGVTPSGKPTLENLCNGSVDWQFNWPDVEGASYYLFELYRNDNLAGSPRVRDLTVPSQFTYSGKEGSVEKQHLDNWRWRYRPVMGFGNKSRVAWSKDFYFNVKPAEDPCQD